MKVAKSHIKWLMPWRVFYYLTWDLFCTYSSVPKVLYFVFVYCTSAIKSAETIFKAIIFLLKYYSDACTMLAEISLPSPSLGLSEKGRIIQNLCIFLVLLHCWQLQRTNPILLKKAKRIYRWACISRNALGFHWLNTLSMGWGSLFFCGVKAPWGRTTIPHGYPFLKDKKRGKEKAIFFAWMVWMDGARLPGDVRRLLGGWWWWWFM